MKIWLKKSGVALLVVIVVILLFSIAGTVVLMLVSSRYKVAKHQIDRTNTFYLAEAGLQHALWRIRNNEGGAGGSHPPAPNLCTLGVESPLGSENPSATESITYEGGFSGEIKYIKTEAGPDATKSSDDEFKIKSKVIY